LPRKRCRTHCFTDCYLKSRVIFISSFSTPVWEESQARLKASPSGKTVVYGLEVRI
jgi:hypothetical protein